MAERRMSDKREGETASAWSFATRGTYVDRGASRLVLAVFLAISLLVVAVPSVGMLWARTDATTENRELSPIPQVLDADGSVNVDVLSDAGAYFDDHFAYRNALVDANARLRAALGVSSTDQVVVGNDGWLYYGGTLPDYLGQNELSDRALRNVAHNLALAQAYAEDQGATFAFMLAPNKNTLYPQHMPYYYKRSTAASNAERLKPLLEEAGVNYVDLFSLFAEGGRDDGAGDGRYLKLDSHWDNRGALRAVQALVTSLGCGLLDLSEGDAEPREDFMGDLEGMLHPQSSHAEVNWYFPGVNDGPGMSGASWDYAEGSDVTDSWIRTESEGELGNLLMFRDSFGNALAPLCAMAFERAAFSKLVPYNLPQLSQVGADFVVIERAERHVGYLAENPPIMPAPRVRLSAALPAVDGDSGAGTTLSVAADGPYWKIEGMADSRSLADDSRILVAVSAAGSDEVAVYDACWKTMPGADGAEASDFGYQVNVPSEVVDLADATVRVLVLEGDEYRCLKTFGRIRVQ